jgi:aminopeptidase
MESKGLRRDGRGRVRLLSIAASNPDLLAGVDPDRIATMNKTLAQNMKEFRRMTQSSKISWCVVSVPTKEWAAKVFPNLTPSEQEAALWEAIFSCTRADLQDPVKAWEDHGKNLQNKVEYLNNKKYKKLHFKAPGTDLTIALPEKHIWVGGGAKTAAGVKFTPNLPTEEVFTTPHREGVNGVVSSTKPLIYGGNMIDEFILIFENGRIINYTAKVGEETLKRLIETDEGSHHLGELALVPYSSPISQSNILFYNTLYDENASNHLAIGSAYPICIENGTSMSTEELTREGSNSSLTHVDFMIGSAKMDIDAENEEGKMEPLFRNGDWAI